MMRARSLIIAIMLVMILSGSVFAQDTCYAIWRPGGLYKLDLGVCDTIRLGCEEATLPPNMQLGDSIRLPIYIWNDYPIGGFSLGFKHTGSQIRFGEGWEIPINSVVPPAVHSHQTPTLVTEGGDSVLIGWVDMTGQHPIPPTGEQSAKLLGYIFLKFEQLVSQTIAIDSAWVPPAGDFEITVLNPSPGKVMGLAPKFVACPAVHFVFSPLCGDVDLSGNVDIADAVRLLFYLFGEPAPAEPSAGDVDCNGRLNIADVVYLVNYIFLGGPPPCADCPPK